MPKPTIVIATSSFTLPHFYTTFIHQLNAHGYDAVAVEYPSVGQTAATMDDDAAAIRKVTMKLVQEDGKDVVLIMHSYGGIPGTDSAFGLGKNLKEGKEGGGVVALVYVTAFMVSPGQSMASAAGAEEEKDSGGGGMRDYVAFEGDFMVLDPVGTAKYSLSHLPEAEAMGWAKQFQHQSTATLMGEVKHATWREIPTTYVIMEDDQGISVDVQRKMVENAKESGSEITTYSLSGGHFPFISKPEAVVEIVRKVAGEGV